MAKMNKFTIDFLDKFRTKYFNNPNRVGMKYYQLTENGKTPSVAKGNKPQIGLIQTNLGWVVVNLEDISNDDVRISRLRYYKHDDVNAEISENQVKLLKSEMVKTFEYNMVVDLNQHYSDEPSDETVNQSYIADIKSIELNGNKISDIEHIIFTDNQIILGDMTWSCRKGIPPSGMWYHQKGNIRSTIERINKKTLKLTRKDIKDNLAMEYIVEYKNLRILEEIKNGKN